MTLWHIRAVDPVQPGKRKARAYSFIVMAATCEQAIALARMDAPHAFKFDPVITALPVGPVWHTGVSLVG